MVYSMINNILDFKLHVSKVIIKLADKGQKEYAKKFESALMISQSGLEILGETKVVIRELEQSKVYKSLDIGDDLKTIKTYIKKYW